MATYNYNPFPTGEPPTHPKSNTEEGVKYRIYNIFKPTIVLDELSLRTHESQETDTRKIEDLASVRYPLIKINNYLISEIDIEYFNIDCTGFLPKITLTVSFTYETFLSREMPKDGDIISVAIRNKNDILNMIRNDYVITGVTSMKRSTILPGSPVNMTFFGELFIPGFRGFPFKTSAFKGTSLEVLKKMAEKLGLGFNTNETQTNDKQVWYMPTTPELFIEEVTDRAWKDENSFFECWVDIYYNLNFVNVNKQLISSEDDVDIGAIINNVDDDYFRGLDSSEEKSIQTAKVFSNFKNYRTTSFYITNWKPINKSSAITFNYGARMETCFFEHINSLYENEESRKYWDIMLDPIYDENKIKNHILLRGRTSYNPEINENELARANYDYTELYIKYLWLGIQYTVSNPEDEHSEWTGNMHKNYMRASCHNLLNLKELEKLNIEVEVQGTNLNVILGDKIPTIIVRNDMLQNMMINEEAQTDTAVDLFYSGWYYVKGFTLTYTKKEDNPFSDFSQKFILTRREWPPPEPIEPIMNQLPEEM